MEHLQTGCNGIKALILSGYESWHTRGSLELTAAPTIRQRIQELCVHMETYHALQVPSGYD